jgi:hypothetical protein
MSVVGGYRTPHTVRTASGSSLMTIRDSDGVECRIILNVISPPVSRLGRPVLTAVRLVFAPTFCVRDAATELVSSRAKQTLCGFGLASVAARISAIAVNIVGHALCRPKRPAGAGVERWIDGTDSIYIRFTAISHGRKYLRSSGLSCESLCQGGLPRHPRG